MGVTLILSVLCLLLKSTESEFQIKGNKSIILFIKSKKHNERRVFYCCWFWDGDVSVIPILCSTQTCPSYNLVHILTDPRRAYAAQGRTVADWPDLVNITSFFVLFEEYPRMCSAITTCWMWLYFVKKGKPMIFGIRIVSEGRIIVWNMAY